MDIKASDYIEEPNVIEVRRRIAAFDQDEAKAACQVLATLHPDIYLDALRASFMETLRVNAEIDASIQIHRDYIKEVTGA